MGILSSTSAISRITGPLWVSAVYDSYGTIYTYLALLCVEVVGTVIVVMFYKYLVPMEVINKSRPADKGEDNLGCDMR